MQSFSSRRLEAKFRKRVAESSSHPAGKVDRFDLKLWNHEVTGPHEARVLVGYSSQMGIPTRLDLDEFIIRKSAAQMRAIPESIRMHPDYELLTAEVVKIPQRRPLHDADPKKGLMIAVTAGTYMDEKEALWEVRKSEEGNGYLARVEKEDIDAILTGIEKSSRTAAVGRRPTLAALRESGILNPQVGDHVAFMHQGSVYHGKVQERKGDNLKVAVDDKIVETMTPDVLDVKETTEDFKQDHKQRLIDIFTQIYGDRSFATELVNL